MESSEHEPGLVKVAFSINLSSFKLLYKSILSQQTHVHTHMHAHITHTLVIKAANEDIKSTYHDFYDK